MRLRLYLLNLWLRLRVKPRLARMKKPQEMRANLARETERHFDPPEDSHFVTASIRHDDADEPIEALWASCGRPDRRKVILYLHGGAYIAGSPQTHRHLGAALAGAAGVRALLPDYRLAPEHPFPAALDDVQSCYLHLLDTGYLAEEIAIAGDSAGGGLAFALVLRLQEQGIPTPACIVGFSPWSDMRGTAPSLRRNASRDVMLPARRFGDVVDFYMAGHDVSDPSASPVLGQWMDPPPALIMASRSEILMDDATGLADGLRRAGGDVQLQLWRNLPHAWPVFTGRLPEANHAVAAAGAFIARHLGVEPEP